MNGPWDHNKLKQLGNLDSYHAFGVFFDSKGETDDFTVSKMTAYQHLQLRMTGFMGTSAALFQMANEILSEFKAGFTAHPAGRVKHGPFNGVRLWMSPRAISDSSSFTIEPTKELTDQLAKSRPEKSFQLRTTVADRACLAYILQQSLDALVRKDSLINILWVAHIAAQKLESGLLVKSQVLADYCHCADDKVRTITVCSCDETAIVSVLTKLSCTTACTAGSIVCASILDGSKQRMVSNYFVLDVPTAASLLNCLPCRLIQS
jgi:hypothetical protein